MKCESCANYMSSIDRCKFCHYEEKKENHHLKWNGDEYKVIWIEISNDNNRIITEWEKV